MIEYTEIIFGKKKFLNFSFFENVRINFQLFEVKHQTSEQKPLTSNKSTKTNRIIQIFNCSKFFYISTILYFT